MDKILRGKLYRVVNITPKKQPRTVLEVLSLVAADAAGPAFQRLAEANHLFLAGDIAQHSDPCA